MAYRHKVDDRDWLELVQATKVKDLLAIKPHQTLRGLPVLADKNATIEETLQVSPSPFSSFFHVCAG
jgi:hypothetical protein